MWVDIANWLLVNIVYNLQVSESIIALIIMIVAIFLFSNKPTDNSLFRNRRVWGALLFVFSTFVFLFANIADLADVFTVWATIILAFVAVFSFEESRRLRKQYKEREDRERREKLLNAIQNWAESGIVAITPVSLQTDANMIMSELDLNLRPVAAKMISVIIYTEKFGGDLRIKVLRTSLRLNTIGRALQAHNKNIDIVKARIILVRAFSDVIKVISDLKSQE